MGYLGIYEFGLTRPYFKDGLGWHWCKCTRNFPDQGVDQVSGNRRGGLGGSGCFHGGFIRRMGTKILFNGIPKFYGYGLNVQAECNFYHDFSANQFGVGTTQNGRLHTTEGEPLNYVIRGLNDGGLSVFCVSIKESFIGGMRAGWVGLGPFFFFWVEPMWRGLFYGLIIFDVRYLILVRI